MRALISRPRRKGEDEDVCMTLGLVKCFDAHKGSGLITPDGGGPEVFVHVSAVERAGLASLDAGDRVSGRLPAGTG